MALSTGRPLGWCLHAVAVLALAVSFAPSFTPIAWAGRQIGSAAQVVNSVTGTQETTRQPEALRAGIDVFQNEAIDTAYASASRVVFQDQTQLSIGPMSQVVLDRFVFDPDPTRSAVAISIAKGVARFSTGLLPKPDYQINTPSAQIGVRGTMFTTIVSADRSSWVSVEEGAAIVSAQGVTVTVNAGQTTFVAFGRPPSPPSTSTVLPPVVTQMDALLLPTNPVYPPPGPPAGGYTPGQYLPPAGPYGSPPDFGGGRGFGGGYGGGRGGGYGGTNGGGYGGANGGGYGGGRGR